MVLYGLGINGLSKMEIRGILVKNNVKGVLDIRYGKYKVNKKDFERWGIDYVDCKKECMELVPSRKLLNGYKDGSIDDDLYKKMFMERLTKNMSKIGKFLDGYDGYVLLCYEERAKFCHRKLIGKFYKLVNRGRYKEISPKQTPKLFLKEFFEHEKRINMSQNEYNL